MNYSRQDCIESLQAAADEMGEPLRVKDYRASGHSPSARTMHERFGGWPDALRAAGLMAIDHGKNGIRDPPKMETTRAGYEQFRARCNGVQHRFPHHRLIAVAEYGFDAVCDKVVHHKNEIPWDNRPGNLEVMTKPEHRSLHARQRGMERDENGEIVT